MFSIVPVKNSGNIHFFTDTVNHSVYRIETENRLYIFKAYNTMGWPEDGKLPFVYRKLDEYQIPHAKMIIFSREDENFPNGYMIEECLPGITADRLSLSGDDALAFYQKLAALVSRIHRISMTGYGYTGNGIAEWTSFSQYTYDSLNDYAIKSVDEGILAAEDFEKIGQAIREKTKICDMAPPVLCHGDLTSKNMLVDAGEITLIDWDDVHSLCWIDDVARLTLLLKLEYGDRAAAVYRKAFFDHYETEQDKSLFYEVEDILQVRLELDLLYCFAGKPQFRVIKRELGQSLEKCGIKCNL